MISGVLALLMVAIPPSPTGAPDPIGDRCLGAPLQLRWVDLLMPSQIGQRLTQPGCGERLGAAALRSPGRALRPLSVGRLKIGSFKIAGEKIGFGLDMMWGPESAFHGRGGRRRMLGDREEIRVVPQLYLPEKWQRAIDTATYPALFIGGAAITTAIILEALR